MSMLELREGSPQKQEIWDDWLQRKLVINLLNEAIFFYHAMRGFPTHQVRG